MVEHRRGTRGVIDGAAAIVPLRFQLGARTLAAIPRRLVRVGLSLDAVLAGAVPALPPLGKADGYWMTSLPADRLDEVDQGGLVAQVRQRYVRYHVDLRLGHNAWLAGLSGNARTAIRRKTKRWAGEHGLDIRGYRTADELATFHTLALPLAALTYQARLMGAGLPDTPDFARDMARAAAADRVRAWLLFIDGRPAAYLYCSAEGESLRYDHVGHDPARGDLSPGTVLHAQAMRELFADRFARFDFTEGEGQHKRQFASGGTACLDLLLLRPTLANRAAVVALAGFDEAMAVGKRAARSPLAARIAKRLRR